MPEVGSASLAIIPSFKGFQGNLERGTAKEMTAAGKSGGDRFGTAAGTAAGSRFKATFGRAAKAALIGVGALGVGAIKLAGDSVKLASDLNESLNAVNVSYGKQGKAVQKLGKQAADSLGLSNEQFNSLAVRFSAFSTTIAGGPGKKVVSTLDDLTTRAADFASVMNLEVNEAAELFQSGLAGETEPLRRYGLDLSAAAVETHAFKVGIAEAGDELTEQQKIQARYSLLMQQTNKTAGDFANTSDSLANRQRILSARWDDARAKLGTALLPTMERVSGWVLDEGLPAFERFADWFAGDGMDKITAFGSFMRDDVAPNLKSAADFAGDLVGWLDKLPKEVKIGGLAALGGLTAVGKLKRSPLGTAASVVGLGKGTPVYVTNWAQMAGGGAGGVVGKGGWVAAAGKTFGLAAAPAIAAYLGYKVNADLNRKRTSDPRTNPGAAGSDEHRQIIAGWQGAEGGVNKYNEKLERTRDNLLTITNGVTGFASANEKARDKVLRVTNGVVDFGDKSKGATDKARTGLQGVGTAADNARAKVRLLAADLDWVARPREARITITRRYAKAGYQTIGGLQETTSGGTTINIDKVEAKDYDDFNRQLELRRQRAALEGRRVG